MYIGALCAYQLGYPRWVIFYDADNFVPSALLEYTLAMSRLFLLASLDGPARASDPRLVQSQAGSSPAPHFYRMCGSAGHPNLDWGVATGMPGSAAPAPGSVLPSFMPSWRGGSADVTTRSGLPTRASKGLPSRRRWRSPSRL